MPGTPVLIGRDPSATVRLDDERVSRIHAELRSDDEGWHLIDRGSTSGTFVGNQRVTELIVRAPTTVRFGGFSSADDVHFELVVAADGLAPPTQIAGPMVLDHTVLPPGAPTRPGGVLAPGGAAARPRSATRRCRS